MGVKKSVECLGQRRSVKEDSQTPNSIERTIQGRQQERRFQILHSEDYDEADRLTLDVQSGRRIYGKKD